MKHSIRTKITLLLTTMVVLTIFCTWIINCTFLSDYYMHSKKDDLNEAYKGIAAIYENNDDYYLSEENTELMEQLASKYDVNVYVFNYNIGLVFPSPINIGKREMEKMEDMEKEYLGFYSPNVEDKKKIKETENYQIFTLYDKQMDSSFIDLIGWITVKDQPAKTSEEITGSPEAGIGSSENAENATTSVSLDDYNMVLLRSNFVSVKDSVAIANEFLAYVGIIAVILGSLAMFLISNRFTKPILDLAGIAKKMSDLDFEIKYKVKSKDEIGELGKSINTLSVKLESTITELKMANNELLTDIQRKTEIDEMRKEFLSNVSHELKTPISLIQGYAEGLKENINEDEESRDFYCEVIMDEANKMSNMVKKLLSLNELEFGSNQVNFDRFDIVTLIKSVLISTEILFKQKQATLYFDQQEPVFVWADELLIEQVITNYISNALNHLGEQKIIEIKLIPRGDTLRIAVFNTGENIPEDEIDKIWIKFYKVDKARTREYGGSGIGLSIVKAIMNSHNKECGAINRPIGVEFWFELDIKS